MLRRALLIAAVAAAALVAPLRAQQPNPAAAAHQIVISDFSFAPARIVVHQGDTIKWVNRDIVRHNATVGDKSWTTGTLMPGGAGSVTATAVGTFNYICTRHPSMKGVIVVEAPK